MNRFLEVLNEMCEALIDEYRSELERNGHSATGELANSITFDITLSDNTFEITFDLADYWIYVENGRGPGKFPPPSSILDWIHAKNILPHEINGKLPTENSLAFLIGRKIANEGTHGTHDMQHSIEVIKAKYEPLLSEALQEDYTEESAELIYEFLSRIP